MIGNGGGHKQSAQWCIILHVPAHHVLITWDENLLRLVAQLHFRMVAPMVQVSVQPLRHLLDNLGWKFVKGFSRDFECDFRTRFDIERDRKCSSGTSQRTEVTNAS
jgi:hypothetical protein